MKKITIVVMTLIMTVFSMSYNVSAKEISHDDSVASIEEYLEDEDTTILEQLEDLKSDYESIVSTFSSDEEIDKVNDLINTVNELEQEYIESLNENTHYRASSDYSAPVAAVVAWFNANGYQ